MTRANRNSPDTARYGWALALSVVSLLCVTVFALALVFNCLRAVAGVYENPLLAIAAGFFTFPVALLSTIISIALVGPRNCKLAWLSLSGYTVPIFLGILLAAWEHVFKK